MFASLVIAPLLMAQSATALMVEQQYETRDVAFEELAAGDAETAVIMLEAELADHPGDPAVLINLGSAYMQLGNVERAQFYYRAARDCTDGYELELADGRWMYSSDAARLALATVELRELASR